jgi:predicted outer membrane repeat protein
LGGAIVNLGTLMVTKSTFSGNNAGTGGGIYNKDYGTLTVIDSTFDGNSAIWSGGGIYGYGTLTVKSSTFSGNRSPLGGAILNDGNLTVTNSTFSDNNAQDEDGGGILNAAMLIVTNSTFSGNSAHSGGGIFNSGTVAVTNSTFSGNNALASSRTGGADIYNASGVVSLKSTILAVGSSGGNCAGAIVDVGYNISDGESCGFTPTGSAKNGDGVDPLLSAAGLANNGGPTQTIALQADSPAIDAIPIADCTDQSSSQNKIAIDQRGFPRPDARGEQYCDIGAYESEF